MNNYQTYMKHLWCVAVVAVVLGISLSAHAGKLDPFWKVLKRPAGEGGYHLSLSNDGSEAMIEVFIKSSDTDVTAARIWTCGGAVRTVVGSVMTASMPQEELQEAETWPEVEYIEVAKPLINKNNVAGVDTRVVDVYDGLDMLRYYDGEGVVVGVIDSGIDAYHDAFRRSASGGSRVLYIWDQNQWGDSPSELSSSYGAEYEVAYYGERDMNIPHQDVNGHGTHVAGTAAGGHISNNYPGVASGSSIIAVKYKEPSNIPEFVANTFSTYVCDAANYIFKKADALGMPAVINISLGTEIGPHDGSTLFDECLDALVEESPGRAVVVSAGNSAVDEEYGGSHVGFDLEAAQDKGALIQVYVESDLYYVDIWNNASCDVDIQVNVHDYDNDTVLDTTGWIALGGSVERSYRTMDYALDRSESVNALNGKSHASLLIEPNSESVPETYYFSVVFSGSCSQVHAWTYPSSGFLFSPASGSGPGYEYVPGDSDSTVTAPGTAGNVITVGACGTRNEWTDRQGRSVTDTSVVVGDIAPFSSRGPSLTDQQGEKPNFTAPGAYVISARSDDASFNPLLEIGWDYVAMAGTSMASPHVAGVVALMLQVAPELTYDQIRDYLEDTSRQDDYVGDVPNDTWGYGKVDAYSAVQAVLEDYPPVFGESGITIDGIDGGATDVPADIEFLKIQFPRNLMADSYNEERIFVSRLSETTAASIRDGAMMGKQLWDEALCRSESLVPSTVYAPFSMNIVRIEFVDALGVGEYVMCVSPLVKGADKVSYGGTAILFSTIDDAAVAVASESDATSSGGGCSIMRGRKDSIGCILIMMVLVTIVGRRKNVKQIMPSKEGSCRL